MIDHLKRPGQGRKNRLSHPNLHITPIKITPQSQSSIESQDSGTYECTRSTTPCPPSYSPASQRSRYSQPNLPTLLISYDRRSGGSPDRRYRMSQPTLNSSLSGINSFNFGMHRGSGGGRLSYTSLRATSGDNSINEEERLSTPNVHALGGSGSPRGSLTMERSSSRLSQPDVRRFALRHDKRERLSQPTLVTGDYYPGRTQQRLSQPCLSSGGINMLSPSPPPYPLKHKRFGTALLQVSQRDRLSQLDIGGKYRNIKNGGSSNAAQVKFNRDRFSIPELETQNDLRLMAGTPKQRFSLDSQLAKQRYSLDSQDSCKSRLLPIASSPIFEHQQMKTEELTGLTSDKLKSPTCEVLQSVIVASTSPIFPPGERRFLAPDFPFTGRKTSTSPSPPKSETKPLFGKIAGRGGKPPPIPVRERMSVPEIRNSSLRRLLDPPVRQRHSIAGNLRQSMLSPLKLTEFSTSSRKSPRYSIDDALEKLKRIEKEENRRNQETNENESQEIKEQDQQQREKETKHIQRHYSYTYETPGSDESSVSTLGRLSVGGTPKRKFLESNFDENEQVITTVIETEIPMIMPSTPAKYARKVQAYAQVSETPKWIRKYLENDSPRVIRKISDTGKEHFVRVNRRSSRRKSSLESIEAVAKKPEEKARSKSASCEERSSKDNTEQKSVKETYVRIVPSNNAQQENRYEVGVETTVTPWTKTDGRGLYGDDTDTDDSTSI